VREKELKVKEKYWALGINAYLVVDHADSLMKAYKDYEEEVKLK
jgi:hypothetical protein